MRKLENLLIIIKFWKTPVLRKFNKGLSDIKVTHLCLK